MAALRGLCRLAASIALCVVVLPVSANMGLPYTQGATIAEPTGFGQVAVASERLRIDATTLSHDDPGVRISATYTLDNTSGRSLPLAPWFATGTNNVQAFEARLDGGLVVAVRDPAVPIPDSWKPPATTPGLDGGQEPYSVDDPAVIRLPFVLPPGRHEFSVEYRARAKTAMNAGPTQRYQFAYLLAPARSWARFGALDVLVQVPRDWRVAATPVLSAASTHEHDVQVLQGHFSGLPADAIAVTLQAPPGRAHAAIRTLGWALVAIALPGGGFLSVRAAWRLRGSPLRVSRRVLRSLGHAACWAGAVLVAGLGTLYLPMLALPPGQAVSDAYGNAFLSFALVAFCGMLLLLGSVLLVALSAGDKRFSP